MRQYAMNDAPEKQAITSVQRWQADEHSCPDKMESLTVRFDMGKSAQRASVQQRSRQSGDPGVQSPDKALQVSYAYGQLEFSWFRSRRPDAGGTTFSGAAPCATTTFAGVSGTTFPAATTFELRGV